MSILIDRWAEIDGYAAGNNLPDLETMGQDRLDNLVWWFVTKDADDSAEVDKFKRRLWVPPKGEEPPPESPWSAANETAAFQSLKAQLTGNGTPTTVARTGGGTGTSAEGAPAGPVRQQRGQPQRRADGTTTGLQRNVRGAGTGRQPGAPRSRR